MSLSDYAERRVLALLLADPQRVQETDLAADDFEYRDHRELFQAITEKRTGDVLALDLPDDLSRFALALDENWTPTNLLVMSGIVGAAARQRGFARSVSRLRGDRAKRFSL
jgi:hypothetical protein